MAILLSDADIQRLLAESKPLPVGWLRRLRTRPKPGHDEAAMQVKGSAGSEFKVVLRQSQGNVLDFSAILVYMPPDGSREIRLRRYNGKSHEHTNPIEGDTFYGFHVHTATERYQIAGSREDTFAEPTDRYADLDGARECLFNECGFEGHQDPQGHLPNL